MSTNPTADTAPAATAGADRDEEILQSWQVNVAPWTDAVRRGQIESRRLATDRAIVDAVLEREPATVLDLGCGEGWLSRALAEHGISVLGVDAIPALIERAQAAGGDFRALSYEQIAAGELRVEVDVVACNFALLGGAAVDNLLRAVPALLKPQGALIVQTLHPLAACGDQPYADGWRAGSWAGFDAAFTNPAPWYFRTLESWVRLLSSSGLRLVALREPLHPLTQKPASVLFVAQVQR